MRKVLTIALNDLYLFVRYPGNLIGLLVIPIALTLVIARANSDGDGPARLRVDVIDHDQSAVSQQFLDSLRQANSSLVLCPFDNANPDLGDDYCGVEDAQVLDAETAENRLRDQTSLALIEIPANFGADVQAGQDVTLVYRSNESAVAPSYILQAVQAAVQRINGAVVASRVGVLAAETTAGDTDRTELAAMVYDRASELWSQNLIKVDYKVAAEQADDAEISSTQAGFGQSVPGMGSMFVMFTVFGGMQLLLMERKNWTLQRLVTMPVSRAQLLGGKIVGRFLMGLAQFLIVMAIGVVVGLDFGKDLFAVVLIMVLYTSAITALSFAIAPRLRTEQQAGSMSLLLSLVLAPLGGAWFPLEVMPEFMQTIGHLTPVAWAMEGFNSLIFNGGDLSTVIVPALVLLAMTVVFFALGIMGFSYE